MNKRLGVELMDLLSLCISEAERIRNIPLHTIQVQKRWRHLSYIRDEDTGTEIAIGDVALRGIYEWCYSFLERKRLTHIAATSECAGWLTSQIVKRIFIAGKSPEKPLVDKLFHQLESHVRDQIRNFRYVWPCHIALGGNGETFQIGGVRFRPQHSAMEEIAKSMEQSGWANENDVRSDFIDYFQQYDSFADVSVSAADKIAAKRMSLLAVRTSLTVIKLFYGGQSATRMRVSSQEMRPTIRAELYYENDNAKLSISRGGGGEPLPDNWWNDLNHGKNAERLKVFDGIVLSSYRSESETFMRRKVLNGMMWFSQATDDTNPASKLNLYVNALESLTSCGERENLAENIGQRVGFVLSRYPQEGGEEEIRARTKRIYTVRSELVHGARSPVGLDLATFADQAGHLARMMIFALIDIMAVTKIDRDPFSNRQLLKLLR